MSKDVKNLVLEVEAVKTSAAKTTRAAVAIQEATIKAATAATSAASAASDLARTATEGCKSPDIFDGDDNETGKKVFARMCKAVQLGCL